MLSCKYQKKVAAGVDLDFVLSPALGFLIVSLRIAQYMARKQTAYCRTTAGGRDDVEAAIWHSFIPKAFDRTHERIKLKKGRSAFT